jgi:hypothetical protein
MRRFLPRLGRGIDPAAYAKVMAQLKESGPIPGLWAKAIAETDGDERASKALYLRLHVAQVLKQQRIEAARAIAEAREAARVQRAKEKGASSTILYLVVGLIVIVTALSSIVASIYLS